MSEIENLKETFSRLAQAHHECGEQYVDIELDAFVKQLTDEEFLSLPPESQLSYLRWYDEAFLGRGQRLLGLTHSGRLPKEFAIEMKTAILEYLITTEVAADVKEAMSDYLKWTESH